MHYGTVYRRITRLVHLYMYIGTSILTEFVVCNVVRLKYLNDNIDI